MVSLNLVADLGAASTLRPHHPKRMIGLQIRPADIAIGQLVGFDPAQVGEYPVFKNPNTELRSGTSLCRLGFPFHQIKAAFDEATGSFTPDPATFPVPFFPNDGILTRFIMKNSSDRSRQAQFIETSTAGLRGQSGGPIFDKDARVCAIQSQTTSLPLGFAPTVNKARRKSLNTSSCT